ncbi:GNAT family N-acetyltransferase [Paenibacillus sp. HJGM_3]|uniref:GNAT family N-acetyltransferase n=1 Tax=Paenibacillus sp. HJGM_3 TaxID=3379816 RepID=UPI0038599F08
MSQSQVTYTIRPLNECTLDEAVALWNEGFSQYYSDMTQTVEKFTIYLGTKRINPTLSVGMFIDGKPAGFVLIATRSVNGKLIAWNGGTGVSPAFRGMGLARPLMKAAVDNMRAAGVHTAYLEVVSKNVKAIAAYEGAGFRIVDDLIGMKREGALSGAGAGDGAGDADGAGAGVGALAGFAAAGSDSGAYAVQPGRPAEVIGLPFYLPHVPWSGQWFQLQTHGGESLQVLDRETGAAVGYALFTRHYNDLGELSSIVLHHCEADPAREDGGAIVRAALAHAFGPPDREIGRSVDNLRASNPPVLAALSEAGFATLYEQKLMVMEFAE